jgi:hypothetical protein
MVNISLKKVVKNIQSSSFSLVGATPPSGTEGIAPGAPLEVLLEFNKPLKVSTLNLTNIIFTPLTGTFDIPDPEYPNICRFTSSETLAGGTTYDCSVTTGVQATDDTYLDMQYDLHWSTDYLGIASTVPSYGQEFVDVFTEISVLFDSVSYPIDPTTISDLSFIAMDSAEVQVVGILTIDPEGVLVTLTPDYQLNNSDTYTVNLTSAIANTNGTHLEADSFTFTTISADFSLLTSDPAELEEGVSVNKVCVATFNSSTIEEASLEGNVVLLLGGSPVDVLVAVVDDSITITPTSPLEYASTYTMCFYTGLCEFGGGHLDQDYLLEFTTEA